MERNKLDALYRGRRDFLKAAGIITGSALLAGCAPEAAKKVFATATGLPVSPTADPIPVFEPTYEPTKTPEKAFEFPYFSQRDPKWQKIPNSGIGSMKLSGCSIATGAMTTFTDPYKYWGFCTDYYGQHLLLDREGWSYRFHDPVLRSHGFDPEIFEGGLDEIKVRIVDSVAKHYPVWVNAVFYGIARGHNSEAIGVDYSKDPKGTIILNDPWYGPKFAIEDGFISPGKNGSWSFAAIRPKAR